MRIAAFPNPSGSRYWRLEDPFKYLRRLGHDARVIDGGITEEVAEWADIVVLQSIIDRDGLSLLYRYQEEHGLKLVADVDDSLDVSESNPYKVHHEHTDAKAVISETLKRADLLTTTTKHLRDQLWALNQKIAILPNLLDLERWGGVKLRPNTSETVRVGWAGSITHYEDLAMVAPAINRLLSEYPQVRLILVGDPRMKELFPEHHVEVQLGVPFEVWPTKLASLRLDIGIAPLVDNAFNRCKSNIKWLEYSAMKIPGVYSTIVYNTYNFDGNLGMIAYDTDQWYRCLENYVLYPHLREEIASHAQAWALRGYDLKRGITKWEKAYQALTAS